MTYVKTISFFVKEGGEPSSKLNPIIKQSYNVSEHYLILGDGRAEQQAR